jgi:hypothetical protein
MSSTVDFAQRVNDSINTFLSDDLNAHSFKLNIFPPTTVAMLDVLDEKHDHVTMTGTNSGILSNTNVVSLGDSKKIAHTSIDIDYLVKILNTAIINNDQKTNQNDEQVELLITSITNKNHAQTNILLNENPNLIVHLINIANTLNTSDAITYIVNLLENNNLLT